MSKLLYTVIDLDPPYNPNGHYQVHTEELEYFQEVIYYLGSRLRRALTKYVEFDSIPQNRCWIQERMLVELLSRIMQITAQLQTCSTGIGSHIHWSGRSALDGM